MAEGRGRNLALQGFAFLVFFVLFLTALGPFDFDFHDGDMEGSWISASTYAGLHRFEYGTQFVFTNGPLFPLYHREVAGELTGWYVLARLAVVLYLATGFAILSGTARLAGWIVVALAFALVWPSTTGQANDAHLLVVPLLTAMLALTERARWPLLLVGIALSAALALAKVSFIPFCVGAFLLVDIAFLSRRKPPLALVSYVVASLALFVLAGQRITDFVPFLIGNYEMTAGYSSALSLDGSMLEFAAWLVAVGFALVVTVVAEVQAVRAGWQRPLIAMLVTLLVVGFLFIATKAAFVRHDSHSFAGWGMWLYLVVLLGLPGTFQTWRLWVPSTLYGPLAVLFAAAIVLFASNPYFVKYTTSSPSVLAYQLQQALAFAVNPSAWVAQQQQRSAEWDALVRREQPLPPIAGRIDAISNVQQSILAAGLDYWPRPTIQENMTSTPALIARNRAFLGGADAPGTLIFAPGATDGRHPASIEGSLWPLLLADYAVDQPVRDQLLLTRRTVPLDIAQSPPATATAAFGKEITIPAGTQPVFMTLDIKETLLGKLAEQALKPPLVRLVVTYADGKSERYRLIPGMIREGMLISPTIRTIDDYTRLARGADLAGLAAPVSIRVETAGRWAYEPGIAATFTTLTIPRN